MSPRALGLTFAATWTLCVVDQIDGDVAAIELAESQLITLPLRCLPPAPHEGEPRDPTNTNNTHNPRQRRQP